MTKWYDKGKEHHVKSMEALGDLYGCSKINQELLGQLAKNVKPWKEPMTERFEVLPATGGLPKKDN